MGKHWDCEDDHDWDDDFDYLSVGYRYWYGKYYPNEQIDALFDNPSKSKQDITQNFMVLFLATACFSGAVYGCAKSVPYIKSWYTEKKNCWYRYKNRNKQG